VNNINISRVNVCSAVDEEFIQFVRDTFPLFGVFCLPRSDWLGQMALTEGLTQVPNIPCIRWFDISIISTGVVAHCCMDGEANGPSATSTNRAY